MKKIFLCIATMMMLFATSCQRVENPNAIGVESEVTFSIQTPELMTRADYGDGTTATDLTVAVYNGEAFLFKEKATMENKQANVKLSLVNGMTYNIVFWAQNADAPYEFTPESHTMVVDYSAVAANNENLDAFWKKIEYKSEGAKTQPVELTRPFAQLNVLASDWYDAVNNSKIEVKATTMTVKNVYNTMNMLTGTVENEEEVTFTENSTPHAVGQEHSSYKTAEGWAWLAMNYILVGEQSIVEAEMTVPNPEVNDKIYRSIPVQRNYRTNIYGRILTSDTDFNVEIKEGFDDEFNYDKFITVTSAEELTNATFNASKDITILFANDIEGDARIHQKKDVNIVVNGNGKKYDGMIDIYGYARHTGEETLKLTNINFEHTNTNTALYFISCNTTEEQKRYAHNVTVENCTFIGNGSHEDAPVVGMRYRQCYNMKVVNCTAQNLHSLMWATGCTNIDVDDIEFTTGSKEGISFGTSTNLVVKNSTIETSGYGIRTDGSVNTSLSVENSTIKAEQPIIVRYNSAEYAVSINNTSLNASKAYEVVFTTGKDSEEYIAPTVNNTITGADDYNVFPRDINADELKASTGGQLNDILSKGTDVILTQNIQIQSSETGGNGYGRTGVTQLKGGTIDGQGKEVGANVWSTWDSAINTTGGTIKNVVVNRGMRGIFINHNSTHSEKVILENVTIDGTVYTISCDQGTNSGLEAENSTFNGWTSYAATLGDVTFTNCSFGEGSGYAYCRPYAPTEFIGCTFEAGFKVEPVAAVTFENCTIGGVALTAENLSTLVTNTSNVTLK